MDEAFLTNVHNEVIYQVKRLQSHPSIVLWSGNNENEAAVAQNWFGIPADKIPKVKADYRKLYVDAIDLTAGMLAMLNKITLKFEVRDGLCDFVPSIQTW